MSGTLNVNLSKPVVSVGIMDDPPDLSGRQQAKAQDTAGQVLKEELEAQKAVFLQACRTLNGVVAKLNDFYDKAFVAHSEEIARLSVEIARKILAHKVENGDYKIESIVKEALEKAPDRQDVVVHLHPEDVEQYQQAQQDEPDSVPVGVTFVSDSSIGRAECVLESRKGIFKSLIDENLERIGQALQNK